MFLRHSGRLPQAVAATGLVLLISAGVGCAHSSSKAVSESVSSSSKPAVKPAIIDKPDSQPGIAAVAAAVNMTFTDPKTGKVQWKAQVKNLDVKNPGASTSNVVGTLHGVNGVLYESGAPANKMIAPVVNIDNQKKTVTATGGVHVVSLTQANTDLRCDKVIWYLADSKLIGEGNVIMHKGTFTQTGPSFAADTRLKAVQMPAPQSMLSGHPPSNKRVNVTFH